jgi:uncharacterized protein YdaU (DUF1376 family)
MLEASAHHEDDVIEDRDEIKGRDPFFRFFVDDWRAGTMGLTLEQKGFYIDLLCLMWDRQGGLPNDPAWIARNLGMRPQPVKRLLSSLFDAGKLKIKDDLIVNGRLLRELWERKKLSERQSKRGKVSAATRAKLPRNSDKTPKKLPENHPVSPPDIVADQALNRTTPDPDPDPEKKEETPIGVSGARKRAKPKKLDTRLPSDWVLPDEWREWAEINFAPDRAAVLAEAERFRDYWLAAAGSKGLKRDWFATWRTWCRPKAWGTPATVVRRPQQETENDRMQRELLAAITAPLDLMEARQ